MNIDDILVKRKPHKLKSIDPDRTITEMAGMLTEHNIGSLIVTDDSGRLIGIASERDIVEAVREFPTELSSRTVADIMTRDVITCCAGDGVRAVLTKMNANKIRHIPVVEDTLPIAMISVGEFEVICNYLQKLALTDELTGLPNRRHFIQNVDIEFNKHSRWQHPFSVAMLDLDHFKRVNDTFGHDVGDEVLMHLAEIFRSQLRAYDIAGRLGGEEFGILFPGTDIHGAMAACQHLIKAIRDARIKAEGKTIRFTASIGIVEVSKAYCDSQSILKRADELLYVSKQTGRDKISIKTALAA